MFSLVKSVASKLVSTLKSSPASNNSKVSNNVEPAIVSSELPDDGIDRPAILRWLEALESGEFKQTKGQLVSGNGNSFCCLGVQCKLEGAKIAGYGSSRLFRFENGDEYDTFPSEEQLNKYGLTSDSSGTLADTKYLKANKYAVLNDEGVATGEDKHGYTKYKRAKFADIAAVLRADYKEKGIL